VRRLVFAALLVALAACSDDRSGTKVVGAPVAPPTTAPAKADDAPPPPDVTLTVTAAEVVGPAAPAGPLVDPVLGQVVSVVEDFLHVTSLDPLTGQPGPGLSHLLLDGAAAQATHEDRGIVFDEGLPPADEVRMSEATVSLRALAGPDGAVQLVVADFVWDVTAAVEVRRTGVLELVPTAAGWQISTYDMTVERA
jgi:hypothetical protein